MDIINAGLIRLFIYLASIKSYPTPLKAASIVSGISIEDIPEILNNSIYHIVDGKIYTEGVKKVG